MYRRHFVSPLANRALALERKEEGEKDGTHESIEKRRRLNHSTSLLNPRVPNDSLVEREERESSYYNVLWRNQTTKKNKTWDGDGILALEGNILSLHNSDGKKSLPPRSSH